MSNCLPPTPPIPTPPSPPVPDTGNYGYWSYNGTNGLRGAASTIEVLPDGRRVIVRDPTNPALLEDEFIIYSIQRVPQARHDFNRLFPTLLPEEQERLSNLLASNPRAAQPLLNDQTFNDNLQLNQVTAGVRTVMPKPTTRIPGRPLWWRPFP
jgi:hypothetical protein